MRELINERHMLKEEVPSDLDILRELSKRSVLEEELSLELEKLEAKEKGVKNVLDYINKYAKDHWFYIKDLSLDYYNTLNCDLLLLTSAGIYTFEINEYEGIFEVVYKQCRLNNHKLSHHPIENIQEVSSQLVSLAMMHSVPVNVKGAAIFPGKNNKIVINEEIKKVDVINNQQLDSYLKQILQEEKDYEGEKMVTPMHLSWLGRIDRHHPNWSITIPNEAKENIQKGILCSHCESSEININDPYVSCNCGMHEPLEEAIVRTICEYGVLNSEKDLYPPELLDFFDDQISMDDLTKHLDKHFTPVG